MLISTLLMIADCLYGFGICKQFAVGAVGAVGLDVVAVGLGPLDLGFQH